MDEYYDAIAALPPWLHGPLEKVPQETAVQIHEIRLRKGSPPVFTQNGGQRPAAACCPAVEELQSLTVGPEQMEDILFCLCGGSIHAFEEELACGYFTLPGGHRVGVGGRFICGPEGRPVLQRVESLNIRVARAVMCRVPPFLQQILEEPFAGMLIAGEPDSGKTTMLRSILPILEKACRPTVIVDERCELFPDTLSGMPGYQWCDRISGLEKAVAIQMALRTLGPQVMLLDELGTLEETRLLEQGAYSGVDFVATVHAASIEEAEKKPQVRFLLSHGMVRHICLLTGRKTPGVVKEGKEYC